MLYTSEKLFSNFFSVNIYYTAFEVFLLYEHYFLKSCLIFFLFNNAYSMYNAHSKLYSAYYPSLMNSKMV